MNSVLKKRLLVDLGIISALFFLPWWCTILLACIALFTFDFYIEILFVGLLIDVLYGVYTASFVGTYRMTLILSGVFIISFWLKHRFIFSRS